MFISCKFTSSLFHFHFHFITQRPPSVVAVSYWAFQSRGPGRPIEIWHYCIFAPPLPPPYCYWWLIMKKRGRKLYLSPNRNPPGVGGGEYESAIAPDIPHDFFLITSGNSTFLIDPWNFHILFFQYPWKFQVLNRLKSDFYLPKNFFITCLNDSPSKTMKNAFYFILKALLGRHSLGNSELQYTLQCNCNQSQTMKYGQLIECHKWNIFL